MKTMTEKIAGAKSERESIDAFSMTNENANFWKRNTVEKT